MPPQRKRRPISKMYILVKRILTPLTSLLLFAAAFSGARGVETPAGAMTERHRVFLETNCLGCHGPE